MEIFGNMIFLFFCLFLVPFGNTSVVQKKEHDGFSDEDKETIDSDGDIMLMRAVEYPAEGKMYSKTSLQRFQGAKLFHPLLPKSCYTQYVKLRLKSILGQQGFSLGVRCGCGCLQ